MMAGKSKKRLGRIGNEPIGYVFIAPFYLFFLYMVLLPILNMAVNSFTNYDLYKTRDFIGLENYRNLFQDSIFLQSVWNTFIYSAMYIVPTMVLGLLFGLWMSRESKGFHILRTGFYLPYLISMVCASTIWLWIFDPSAGVVNQIFRVLGWETYDWLKDPDMAMGCVVFISIWKNMGYCMLIYLSGIKAIPAYLYEAAEIDGASRVQRFWYITLPMLQPTTFFLFITSCIASFNVFEQVNVLTNGGPLNTTTTVVHQIYIRGFTQFKMGYASAMSVMLFLAVCLITLVNFRFGNQGQDTDIG